MFTGIVAALGTVTQIENGANSSKLTIESKGFFVDIKLGDSIQ